MRIAKNKGSATITELTVLAAGFAVIAAIILMGLFANNRAFTESRATDAAKLFAQQNDIEVKRLSCAGDSDGDGYGSCTLVSKDNEKINLQCPTGFMSTKVLGATGCKEVDIRFAGMGIPVTRTR